MKVLTLQYDGLREEAVSLGRNAASSFSSIVYGHESTRAYVEHPFTKSYIRIDEVTVRKIRELLTNFLVPDRLSFPRLLAEELDRCEIRARHTYEARYSP